MRDFKFPRKETLPQDIAGLVDYQGATASQEHFDSVVQKICRYFKAKPRHGVGRTIWIITTIVLLAIGVCVGIKTDRFLPYPFTREDNRQLFDSFTGTMIRVVETYNELLAVKQAVIDVKCYGSYETIQERFDVVKNHFDEATNALNRTLMPNSGLRVDLAAVSDFIEDLRRELDEVMDLIILVKSKTDDFIQDCADGETLLELIRAYSYPLPNGMCEYWPEDYLTQAGPTENNVCRHLQSESEISARVFVYKTTALFNMVPQDMLVNFRNEAMRRWTAFEQSRGEWLLDRMHVVHNMEFAHRQLQEIIERQSQILGFKWQTLVRVYRDAYQIRMGTSSAAADSKGDLLRHDELKDEISQAVAEVRENLCKKLVPDEGDDGWRLWNKAICSFRVRMVEEAIVCINAVRRLSSSDVPVVLLDTFELVCTSKDELPFKEGRLVCAFEPPATDHAIYRIGDVITEVDGKSALSYTGHIGSAHTIYRLNTIGVFEKRQS